MRRAVQHSLEHATDGVADGVVARILNLGGDHAAAPATLSREQLVTVRDAAIAKAKALGISKHQADLLGDALAGKLAIGG